MDGDGSGRDGVTFLSGENRFAVLTGGVSCLCGVGSAVRDVPVLLASRSSWLRTFTRARANMFSPTNFSPSLMWSLPQCLSGTLKVRSLSPDSMRCVRNRGHCSAFRDNKSPMRCILDLSHPSLAWYRCLWLTSFPSLWAAAAVGACRIFSM